MILFLYTILVSMVFISLNFIKHIFNQPLYTSSSFVVEIRDVKYYY